MTIKYNAVSGSIQVTYEYENKKKDKTVFLKNVLLREGCPRFDLNLHIPAVIKVTTTHPVWTSWDPSGMDQTNKPTQEGEPAHSCSPVNHQTCKGQKYFLTSEQNKEFSQ